MTYKEKAKEVHPDLLRNSYLGGVRGCPSMVFKGATLKCVLGEGGDVKSRCTKCWNQEYKGEELI